MKYITSILLLPLLFLFACADINSDVLPSTDEGMVTFSVSVPNDAGSFASRSLSAADENAVNEIDVLLFNASTGAYIRTVTPTGGTITTVNSEANGSIKRFSIRLLAGVYDVVVLANATQILNSISIAAGEPKADVLNKLTLMSNDRWSITQPNFRPIPMSGQHIGLNVEADKTNAVTIDMVRMLARINVRLNDAINNFVLESVFLFNRQSGGRVTPIGTLPSTVGTKPTNPETDFLRYDVVGDRELLNTIYTFEARNTDHRIPENSGEFLRNTCLVVGGRFNGGATSYYRIDFIDTDGNFRHVLRNHSYNVEIQDVSSEGSPTPEIAFKSHRMNIEASVSEWLIGNLGDIAIERQHELHVSSNFFRFSSTGESAELTVSTTYPTGWSIAPNGIVDAVTGQPINWVTLSRISGAENEAVDITLTVGNNFADGSVARAALIHIRAQFATFVVRVEQTIPYFPLAHRGWAGSNIYWDGTRLTFDDVGVRTNEQHQGLFSMWGGLWLFDGVSGNWATVTNSTAVSNVAVYNLAQTADGWQHVARNNYTYLTLPKIPNELIIRHPNTSDTGVRGRRARNFLYEVHNPSRNIGDICRLITEQAGGTLHGKRWRMPTGDELAAVSGSGTNRAGVTISNRAGRENIPSGRTATHNGVTFFFPRSGYRSWDGGNLSGGLAGQMRSSGTHFNYWSSSPTGSTATTGQEKTWNLRIMNNTNAPSLESDVNASDGFSIRCVVKHENDTFGE